MASGAERDETELERLDRNLDELLSSLRVALPGVQVLFAFLLVLPFQSRFPDVTGFQEKLYIVTLLCVAVATILMIAPTARTRLRFRADDKAWVVRSANRLAIAGLVFLGAGTVCALTLVTDFLFGTALTIGVAATGAALLAWLWFGAPLVRGGPGRPSRM